MTWECVSCANEFTRPRKPKQCSECGCRRIIAQDGGSRERDADDHQQYSDPRDERAERRGLD